MRVGLIGAPTFLAIAALGFVLGPNDMSDGSMSIPSLMVIIALVAGIAMLIFALAAKLLGRAQSGRRRDGSCASGGAMQALARAPTNARLPAPAPPVPHPKRRGARVRSRPP